MAKRESTFKNMVTSLLVITLIASTSLGFIYELTKEPIRLVAVEKKNSAIRNVVPDFDNNPGDDEYRIEVPGGELIFYPATKNGELVGTAVETFTNNGFSGTIRLMVGLLPDGTINGIEVIEHRETPGLGDKMESGKSDFSVQFEGKDPETFRLRVRQDGGDVDGITATTISSRAYCEAVEKAWKLHRDKDADISYELPSIEEALASVLPSFGNNPVLEDHQVVYQDNAYNLYRGRQGRRITGIAVESWSESGYRGNIRLLIGFTPEGVISGIEVLEHRESRNWGGPIENKRSDFYKQFINLNPSSDIVKIKEDGGVIDIITSATVTSRAYCEAVEIAWEVFKRSNLR